MASYDEHCADCVRVLGRPYGWVHAWLDALYDPEKRDIAHRIHRHNRETVDMMREKLGDGAAKAAEIHIIKDMGSVMRKYEVVCLYKPNLRGLSNTRPII